MPDKIRMEAGTPYPLGATMKADGSINFAAVMNGSAECGILLYHKKNGRSKKLVFTAQTKVGNIWCMRVYGINPAEYEYNFFDGEKIITDPYAKLVFGNEKWGKTPATLRAGFYQNTFEWGNDRQLMHDYSNSYIYLLHVRGFTKHSSSGVKEKGTFSGIIEKIPYLKELGITALELMPAYEFVEMKQEEVFYDDRIENTIYAFKDQTPKLNYWGYQKAFYFSPKFSYCGNDEKQYIDSFKRMVYELHQNQIEVIMQFYFPGNTKQAYILEILKFWVYEYHIDGIHLMGEKIPASLLGSEPMLANIKLFYYGFPLEDIYEAKDIPEYKNLAVCTDDFMYDVRRFLKSDEGMLGKILHHSKYIPVKTGMIHYITHSNGFTLADMVSYDRKHNEENGEHNLDGNVYNCTWNCGIEGKTTRKAICKLREKQMKNAEIMNVLLPGTPLIVSGDEFMNSQNGNNNPYCIDNATTWLNWKQLEKNTDMFSFMKQLIALKEEYSPFHRKTEAKMTDYLECGYPDLSFHGEEPWKLQYDNLSRHFAMLYAGEYSTQEKDNDRQPYIYLAFNMHWCSHEFVLPKLNKNRKWYMILNTEKKNSFISPKCLLEDQKKITVLERSIIILIGE